MKTIIDRVGARWLVCAVMCMCGSVAAQDHAATLSADTIALGDQTVLTLGQMDAYPSANQLSQGGLLALSQDFDTAARQMRTVLTCFEPGEHWVHVGPEDSLLLVVTDIEVDTTSAEIRDIAGLERVPYTFWELFRWVLLVLGLAAIGLLVWWYIGHRKQLRQALGLAEPEDTRSPYERACDRLADLKEQKMWQTGKVKQFYTEVTDIVRLFIEESTGIRATDMTSDETLDAVRSMADPASLHELFTMADLVKFAKREPLPHENERALECASHYIDGLWEVVKPKEDDTDREAGKHDA